MKKFKIPVKIDANALVEVSAKSLHDAIMNAYAVKPSRKDVVSLDILIPIVDEKKLREMYPKEFAQMDKEAEPRWKKLGWSGNSEHLTKNGYTICSNPSEEAFDFSVTLTLPSGWSNNFNSQDEALDYAEKEMKSK